MLRSYTYENQLVGMPFSCSAIMLYYNCDMFREVGLDPNTPPTTIAEMADDISKLMVKDGDTVTRYGLNVAVRRYRQNPHEDSVCGLRLGGGRILRRQRGRPHRSHDQGHLRRRRHAAQLPD